jgi:hypothetical protein
MFDLDSRLIRFGDSYTQAFPRVGDFSYRVEAPTFPHPPNTYMLHVSQPGPNPPALHEELVSLGEGYDLLVRDQDLTVFQHDLVRWHTESFEFPAFRVVGGDVQFQFDSARLTDGAVYTHRFGSEGTYEWVDANGSGIHGTVRVDPPPTFLTSRFAERHSLEYREARTTFMADYQAAVSEAKVVRIHGSTVDPPELVGVAIGQPVVWIIQNAPGITITDRRLMPR